jgi:hypothetical protein
MSDYLLLKTGKKSLLKTDKSGYVYVVLSVACG